MPRPGRAPVDDGTRRRTNSPDEWLDVPNVPYEGPHPDLPATRWTMSKAGLIEIPYSPQTQAWWRMVCRLPHAKLWDDGEWQYALTTAIVADNAMLGSSAAATQLNIREKVLGTTPDYRRGLRIRYTDPETGEVIRTTGMPTGRHAPSAKHIGSRVGEEATEGATVAQMSDYRDL